METLYLIPARGGSKGIPGKNIKLFSGKPLISYSIELARQFASDDSICVSTDNDEIASIAESIGLVVPFRRPQELSTDEATTNDVILHAIKYYKSIGRSYDSVVLLQPTSPFRQEFHLRETQALYSEDVDLVMSVKLTDANPYFVLFEENKKGFLEKSKIGDFTRRQDCPEVWQANGAIYIYNVKSLQERKQLNRRILKYVMDKIFSVDLDTELDWQFAEFLNSKLKLL
jgi:CMP-N,N'-diacetyllegionaminic acid synthase